MQPCVALDTAFFHLTSYESGLKKPFFAYGPWLLHPEPASRPKIDEVMKSEFLNEPRDDLVEREAFIELKEKIEEQELLLDKQQGLDSNKDDFPSSGSRKRIKIVDTSNSIEPEHQQNTIVKSSQLMKNFKKLESTYFSTRHRALIQLVKPLTLNARTSSDGKGSTVDRSSTNSFPPINWLSQNK
ncbi:hypothetical protein Hanom_Chr09g00856331 [Helianthus anomalus]